MSDYMDLEQTITDAVNDSVNDITPEVDTPVEVDTPSEPVEAPVEASSEEPVGEVAESVEVASPAAQTPVEGTPAEAQDEFAKLAGMPQMGVGGRENRIPYSRVKKITETAVGRVAEAALGRKLNQGENPVDAVKSFVAQIPELTTKLTDYESRLDAVGQFEQVMANDPQKFLTMLSKVPAYSEFFDFIRQAQQVMQGQTPADQPAQTVVDPSAEMPQPDEELSDGSKVYSMDGLQKLLDWKAQQVENRIASKYETQLKELESRYNPVVSEWQERRRQEAVLPVIRKQLEDARTWPLFNESENEILDVLQKDQQISLEGAYRQVVFPKLVAERSKVRQDVLREVQSAPATTSVAGRASTKPQAPASGPRSLEDIIKESVQSIQR